MHELIGREITDTVKTRLKNYPAVALLGARQVGKSTIAGMIIEQIPKAIHLDLERPADLNKLTDPDAFFAQFSDHMICLDEIQRTKDMSSKISSPDFHAGRLHFIEPPTGRKSI
jgi:hypothetical protein